MTNDYRLVQTASTNPIFWHIISRLIFGKSRLIFDISRLIFGCLDSKPLEILKTGFLQMRPALWMLKSLNDNVKPRVTGVLEFMRTKEPRLIKQESEFPLIDSLLLYCLRTLWRSDDMTTVENNIPWTAAWFTGPLGEDSVQAKLEGI